MTREESISLIKSAQLMLINPTTNEPVSDLYEALEMAIQALEMQPLIEKFQELDDKEKLARLLAMVQEPCDDAISRETVIDTLQYAWEANKDIQESIVEIKALPSVTQKLIECDAVSRIFKRMWNCRGKHTTSIDKVKMEQIIRDELSVTQKSETVTEFADRCRECGAKYGKLLKQKSGHWISHYDEDAKEGWYECDRCHTERAFNTRFCPDCGACMREGRTLDEFIEDNKESEDKE